MFHAYTLRTWLMLTYCSTIIFIVISSSSSSNRRHHGCRGRDGPGGGAGSSADNTNGSNTIASTRVVRVALEGRRIQEQVAATSIPIGEYLDADIDIHIP